MTNKTAQEQLIELYEQQIQDLTMMSKIELGDDVIAKIKQLKEMHGGEMNNNPGVITNNMNNTTTGFGFDTLLDTVTFTFTQETNCVDGPSNDIETLTVEAKSSLGIDGDGGAFFVLKTEQWAVDNSNEISELIKRCERAIDAIVK